MLRTETFGALHEREFRLLWLGQATSVLGDFLVPVATAFAVLDLTGSASDLGLVLAAHIGSLVLFTIVGGVWADRLPRQLVMLGADAVRCVVQATIAALLISGQAQLWHLIALLFVYGTAEAFFQPAATGLVPATVSGPRLQQANALLGLSRNAGSIVGPAVAGLLVGFTSPGVAFAVDAGTFAVSIASLALLRPRIAPTAPRETFLADLREGWHELLAHTWLWVIVVWAATFLFFVVAPMNVLGPLVAKQSLGGASAWGAIAAAWGVGTLLGSLTALRWKPERPMYVCALLTFPVALAPALLALRAPVAAIAAGWAVGGVGIGIFMALWNTTLQQHVAPDKLSRVSAYDWMGSSAMMPLGYVLAGPVAAGIGVSTTLWIAVGWTVASTLAVLLVRSVRELRRLDLEPPLEPLTVGPGPTEALGLARPEP